MVFHCRRLLLPMPFPYFCLCLCLLPLLLAAPADVSSAAAAAVQNSHSLENGMAEQKLYLLIHDSPIRGSERTTRASRFGTCYLRPSCQIGDKVVAE